MKRQPENLPRVLCVVGTRPDAIKMAPVVREFLQFRAAVETILVSTGQHREMLGQVLNTFSLSPSRDLALMAHGQTLGELTAHAVKGLERTILDLAPAYVLAQGDTSSTFCASLAAFYCRVPFGHVEAGLRTPTVEDPFPEEFNRRASGLIASHHFAPTPWAASNLLSEGKPAPSVMVTGNTGIDAVLHVSEAKPHNWFPRAKRVVLLTTHRRENWGDRQAAIARACLQIVNRHSDCTLVVPMHKNPTVRESLMDILSGKRRVHLIEPPPYEQFVSLMKRSTLILTDSGGIQEEAPTFGVPVLVLRDTTERPEGIEANSASLVGTNESTILSEASRLLNDPQAYRLMSRCGSPYGDGRAAARIRYQVLSSLGQSSPQPIAWPGG